MPSTDLPEKPSASSSTGARALPRASDSQVIPTVRPRGAPPAFWEGTAGCSGSCTLRSCHRSDQSTGWPRAARSVRASEDPRYGLVGTAVELQGSVPRRPAARPPTPRPGSAARRPNASEVAGPPNRRRVTSKETARRPPPAAHSPAVTPHPDGAPAHRGRLLGAARRPVPVPDHGPAAPALPGSSADSENRRPAPPRARRHAGLTRHPRPMAYAGHLSPAPPADTPPPSSKARDQWRAPPSPAPSPAANSGRH
jgi:hypothetical protein